MSVKATTAVVDTVTRFRAFETPRKLAGDAGEVVDIGLTRVRYVVRAPQSLGGFSLVECAVPPRTLVAPLHRHTWEDEYSFVLEGRMGALLGDEVIYAQHGELVFKPRRQWHTFWNPDDVPCRILEIISPGGFEFFFDELASAMRQPDFEAIQLDGLGAPYGLDFDLESVPQLCAEHGLEWRSLYGSTSPRRMA